MGHSDIRCSYKRIQVVGQGAFGCCWLVQGGRGEQYILRQIDVSKMSDKLKQEAANEVRVLSRLRHPFIINYRECFVEDGLLCVVTDFAESGDLYRSIEKQRAKQDLFSEELVLRWFTQIALALKHIHDRHILHRDLKTQNIFLAGPGEGIVKVGDFGIARVLQHTQDLAKTAIGTPFYLSPEICQEKPYSYQSDIWSLGCILYELATLRHAFDADSMQGLVVKILRGIPSEVASTFSVEFRHMIPKMLQKDPHHRPSVDAILKMTLVRRTIRHLLADLESQQGHSQMLILQFCLHSLCIVRAVGCASASEGRASAKISNGKLARRFELVFGLRFEMTLTSSCAGFFGGQTPTSLAVIRVRELGVYSLKWSVQPVEGL